ncbi:MAG: CCC motif membrane protein [Bacteroidales bacterium]|jgi:hypothetical protein
MEDPNTNNPYQQPPQTPQGGFYQQPSLPNSAGILVMGILSIVFCWAWGIVGLILGIISLALSGKANLLHQQNPNMYSQSSYNNMKAGRVCAIIGTALSALFLIYLIIVIAFFGTVLSTLPWDSYRHY